jgi:hypothetical protein
MDLIAHGRLNLQHYLYRDIFGYNLHPTIPIQNTPNLSVIDIGTGTGLVNLSRLMFYAISGVSSWCLLS